MSRMTPDYAELARVDRSNHLHPKTNPVTYQRDGGTMIVGGQGVYLTDSEGNRLLDGVAGLANVNVGYGHPQLIEAIHCQLNELSYFHTFTGFSNPASAALTERLRDRLPATINTFYYVASGSEAIDTAAKIASFYWRRRGQHGKRKFIAFRRGYHGNTVFASALTGMPEYHDQFALPLDDIIWVDPPFQYEQNPGMDEAAFSRLASNRIREAIEAAGPDTVAGLFAEPMLASGGGIIPPKSFWPEVRRICDALGVLLIFDEVITGFGRLGEWLGETAFGVTGDICAMAKGISSAYIPMGAVGLSDRVADVLMNANKYFMHGFSATGHPVAAAATLANIEIIESEGLLAATRTGPGLEWRNGLDGLSRHDIVGDIRRLGFVGVLHLDPAKTGRSGPSKTAPAARFSALCRDRGLIVRGGEEIVLMSPPLCLSASEAAEMIGILDDALTAFASDPD
ncbi:MAG: aspartate aminotransferase family protein [Pseudomonadota bacterium]